MYVPEDISMCVVFLMYDSVAHNERRPCGTCAVLSVNQEGRQFDYFVTAKHVISGVQKYTADGVIFLRINTKQGFVDVPTTLSQWKYHRDETVDVAALPIFALANSNDAVAAINNLDIHSYPALLKTEQISGYQICPGFEVFVCGLFSYHIGKSKIVPIIRVGNIAAMPKERVASQFSPTGIEAYLIECRSISGLSGSPVFVLVESTSKPCFFLVGLIHGHFDVPDDQIDASGLDVNANANKRNNVNTGIAMVVPAPKILELLESPEFGEARKEVIRRLTGDLPAHTDAVNGEGKDGRSRWA
jgi:hypothetical protein